MIAEQLEMPLFAPHPAQYRHDDTATCQNCHQTITYKADRAHPYWEHPNKYPYCKGADGQIGKADPDERVLVEPLGCQTFSLGQCCRHYAGHDGPHSFGGGLSDPVHPRHCDERTGHQPHAWECRGAVVACSGADLDQPMPPAIVDVVEDL